MVLPEPAILEASAHRRSIRVCELHPGKRVADSAHPRSACLEAFFSALFCLAKDAMHRCEAIDARINDFIENELPGLEQAENSQLQNALGINPHPEMTDQTDTKEDTDEGNSQPASQPDEPQAAAPGKREPRKCKADK